MRVLVRSMVPAAGPVAAYAGGHCAVHDDGARCAKSVGGARARLVVRPRAFHAWAELDRHILYLSGGDAGLARLGGGAAAVAVSRHLSGRGNGAGLAVRPRRCISLHAVVRRRLDADGMAEGLSFHRFCVEPAGRGLDAAVARRAIRARSEEHTSELQSLMRISYAVFCLKK